MKLEVRRSLTIVDDKFSDFGRAADAPLRKVAVAAVLTNPFAGSYVEDLSPLVKASLGLGESMAAQAMAALGSYSAQSYGKGGIVGTLGEQEHANALLTTVFADPFRHAIGAGAAQAWISSMTKVGAAGAAIDIPMNHIGNVYVRSHYDGMSLVFPDAPLPDEVVIIFCLASRGRLNARVGGMTHETAMAKSAATD